MSWAGLSNNQTVSFNNLQNAVSTGVFTAKTSIPASNEQITKTDANTYVNINTSYAPYAAKASNQLVVKSDLQASGGTPATIYWYVGNQSGGNLKVTNNVGTELLNITSSAGSSQSGTLTVPSSQLPYTITGSWVSGSGNIVRFRVCDDYGSELYYSGDIAVGESASYTPSPTPTVVYVNLTSRGVVPPPCAV